MAIMIQLGKRKYRERLSILLEDRNFDEKKLAEILTEHGLNEKWNKFRNIQKGRKSDFRTLTDHEFEPVTC